MNLFDGMTVRPTPLGLIVVERPEVLDVLGIRFADHGPGLILPERNPWDLIFEMAMNHVHQWRGQLELKELSEDDFDAFYSDAAPATEPDPEPEPAPEPVPDPDLHLKKAREALYSDQPRWWLNVFPSVTGLRFWCCGNLFEDGEHSPWCPATVNDA